jgi:cystathionine gamma-synthase
VTSSKSGENSESLRPDTVAVVAGRPAREQGNALNPPVVFTSTYYSAGVPGEGLVYARVDTETWQPFEEALGLLEGAELPALVFGSGLAAIAAALSLLPVGGTVVVPRHAYQMALAYLDDGAAKYGWQVRRVDIADTAAVLAALDGSDVLLVESPTNPMLEVADLPVLLAAAKERNVITLVDNTFATPLGQQPLKYGADVVIHSVTKYLAGHSDVVLGALVTNSPQLREELKQYRSLHGAVAGPMEVWLALRGLRTLGLRLDRAQANAAELAKRLAAHPKVTQVRHPSLPNDPGHERAAAQMNGFGAIIGLRLLAGAGATTAETADAFISDLRLWVPATSLGGVESMIERRRRWPSESKTVPEDFIRLSVGIENLEDLWADLAQALDKIAG